MARAGFLLVIFGFTCLALGSNAEPPLIKDTLAVGGTVVCEVPPELVVREGKYMVAKEVTAKLTVTINGKAYVGTLTFPDVKVRRTGAGRMTVDACVAHGSVH